jgi:hypothetical protein
MLLLSFDASAQRYKKRPTDDNPNTENNEIITPDSTAWQKIRRKLVFGGGAGAAFSTGGSFLEISPLVGYRITNKWQAGIGGTYIRAWGTRNYYDPNTGTLVYSQNYATSLYGGRLYSEYDILKQVFLHGEYEALNLEYYDYYKGEYTRTWIGNPLVGAGFRSSLGGRASFNILALYNLNYAQNQDISPYPSPLVLRMNFSF